MPSASSDSNHGKNISWNQRSVWVLNLGLELNSARTASISLPSIALSSLSEAARTALSLATPRVLSSNSSGSYTTKSSERTDGENQKMVNSESRTSGGLLLGLYFATEEYRT